MTQNGGTRRWLACGLAIGLLTSAGSAPAQQPNALKAAFVLNFLKFAEWPASGSADANKTLVIAVIGDDPMTEDLKTALNGKVANGREVVILTYRNVAEWKSGGRTCHALFLTPAAKSIWPELRADVASRPMLTMGELPGFCAEGGMLNLFESDNRIRFEANPAAAEKEGLKLRSTLLQLATIVKTGGGQ